MDYTNSQNSQFGYNINDKSWLENMSLDPQFPRKQRLYLGHLHV